MQTKNFKPKTIHKKFHDNMFQLGCVITGSWPQLHHVVGASYRKNGVWLGQWYLIPLSPALHMNGNVNVTSNKKEFFQKVGSEKKLFWWMLDSYVNNYYNLPIPAPALGEIFMETTDMLITSEKEAQEENTSFHEFLQSCEQNDLGELANATRIYIKESGGDLGGVNSRLREV